MSCGYAVARDSVVRERQGVIRCPQVSARRCEVAMSGIWERGEAKRQGSSSGEADWMCRHDAREMDATSSGSLGVRTSGPFVLTPTEVHGDTRQAKNRRQFYAARTPMGRLPRAVSSYSFNIGLHLPFVAVASLFGRPYFSASSSLLDTN
jgi:hypothetical protein